jgi:uncharacterized iron-regulated protein
VDTERLPSEDDINDARAAADNARRERQENLRRFANEIIDELEEEIMTRASGAGLSDPGEFLEYVELMLSNRVIERRLAP